MTFPTKRRGAIDLRELCNTLVALRRFLLFAWWLIRKIAMAFSPPRFNLTVDIYRTDGVGGFYGTPTLSSPACLSQGRRVLAFEVNDDTAAPTPQVSELLLPKLTDIRATWNATVGDCVEVPQGSKRFYFVLAVDDVGKGWPNEYRLALITYEPNGNTALLGANSAPVPLP